MTLPQELVEAILENVGFEDLKTCSLTASNLRFASQRILLSSLTLGTVTPENYIVSNTNAVYTLLDESPHLIAYITRLRIHTSPLTIAPPTEVETVQKIFRKLMNVRRCDIGVRKERAIVGIFKKTLCPAISEAIIAFISHHILTEVHVWDVALRSDVVCLLVSRVPKLSFIHMEVHGDLDFPFFAMMRTTGPSSLETGSGSDSICDFLSAPHFTSYTSSLRRLSVVPYQPHSNRLLMVASSRLEYVHFNGWGLVSGRTISPLPSLPSLRFVSIEVSFLYRSRSWFSTLLSSILDSSPMTLQEVAVMCYPIQWGAQLLRKPLKPEIMTALDAQLATTHLARPCLRLCYDLHLLAKSEEDSLFPPFVTKIVQGMPRIYEQGRLVVEKYSHKAGTTEWLTRR
ncbi:hypothetical protein B0H11DRAFT_2105644 [Mycena galericulata]|nr:hypothetical protein B0H11DRAFT_2105644 [Mycena galericulata]